MGNSDDLHLRRPEPIDQPERKPSQSKPTVIRVESRSERRGLDYREPDVVQVPLWDGDPEHPFPSVKVRMDFRGLDVGDFVCHCHVAEHGDHGMMAIIRVNPAPAAAKSQPGATVRPAG